MLLIDAVIISFTRRIMIKTAMGEGKLLIAAISENLVNCGFTKIVNYPACNRKIDILLKKSRYSSLLILRPDMKKRYAIYKKGIMEKELIELTNQAIKTKKILKKFTGSTWGVFRKQKAHLVISSPVMENNKLMGGISIVLNLNVIFNELRKSQKPILSYIWINALILSLMGLYTLSKITVRPIKKLLESAETFNEENGAFFLNEQEGSEFNQLSKALNRLVYRISQGKKELRRTVKSLEKANIDLKKAQNDIINAEKLASVGRLSAGIAHEIGNPISIVLGYLELLRQEDITDDERKDFLGRAENEINRINFIIRQLLDFSRPSTGIDMRPVEIHEIINDIADVFKFQPAMSKIEIKTYLRAKTDTIMADPSQLRQLFLNLMINAADAISSSEKSSGIIKIETKTIKDENTANDASIEILFTDNGIGIPKENMGNLFDPFFTTKEPGKGTGLGLSVSYMIVEALGGKIKAESLENHGTTMHITLPLYHGENSNENGRIRKKITDYR